MSKELLKVFVYGTLKVGGRFAKRFDDLRVSNKSGKIKGTMFNISDSFPGVVLNGEDVIVGEVHEYTEPTEVEKALDRIEGFFKEGHPQNLYNKEVVEVETEDGIEKCKMYTFAPDTDKYQKIAEGTWKI